ncbi:hypothetical protein [Streptomyces albidoflavus]|uniref:hypothetical protein n=1 Tax=Streptomyces albidoflavus TaxID=1886 RepID=UPI001C3EC18C|nr:hypothetical protein [Streptomyces albidoflavus]
MRLRDRSKPGSLPSGSAAASGTPAALPGALALPGQRGDAPAGLTGLLGPDAGSGR